MYSFFGWLSAGILLVLILPFILIRVNKYTFKTRDAKFFNLIKVLRSLHKPLGILFLATAFYHGYLVLGRITMHTGTVLFVSILLSAVMGGTYFRTKNNSALKAHRFLALASVLLFLIHFFYPYAFS